ncbi:hypothetical protein BX659_11044 [Orenia metallireducens]|uniref:Uncharacterized protein n=1 Tax=Orenia metallireducens TaxID=1413210 RepID=A0A285I157_9FIRM|nr:hypothetical protein BX659_11044 [Orenia metallireducens]SNY40786.1 hypothetical protein SAMN06265827_12744 [Orenia metallireducens]
MNKIDIDFIMDSYEGAIPNYSSAAKELGMWESE